MVGTNSLENSTGNLFEGFKLTAHRWFPVAPAVLKRVQERVYSKHYNQNPTDLISDVRSDASLYLFCVRKLRRIIRTTQSSEDTELLRSSIGSILSELKMKQAHHAADKSLPFQLEREREIVLSSAVVDLLGEKLSLDRDAGFTCALLRQLGFALIAWNYPTIYREALEEVGAQGAAGRTDLNTILHANLGFSPTMLGVRFAEAWGLPAEVTGEIGSHGQHEPALKKGGSLAVLCEIGEAFARANNPHHYPNPRDDWEMAMNVLGHHLGPDGVETVQRHAGSIYGETIKRLLPASNLKAVAAVQPSFGGKRFENNLFVKPLPHDLQEKIKALYGLLEDSRVNPELIRELLQNIAERLGFGAAVVYTLDPAEATLNPVFRKGKPSFTALRAVSTIARPNDMDPIRRAFASDLIVCEKGQLNNGSDRLLLALPIRGKSKIGVLYLEQACAEGSADQIEPLLGAKFIAACLKDLLLLN